MTNDFTDSEVTSVSSNEEQQDLLSNTDQDFQTSEFWFRFQNLEKENLLFRNAFRLIRDCMLNETIITDQLRDIIFRIASNVTEENLQIFE